MRITSFILALALTSCIHITTNQNVATGEVEERTFPLTCEITSIAASGSANIIVDPSIPRNEIRVTTHTDVFDNLKIETEGMTLNIGLTSTNPYPKTFNVRIPALGYTTVALSGGCDMDWRYCGSEYLTVSISGGADIEIKGICRYLTVAASGGADADLDELPSEYVEVAASGGADVEVYATKSLTVNASGGADVSYKGNPENKDISKSGGADVYLND